MKKILLISYGDYDFDGRLRELTKIFDNIGEVFSFSKGKKKHFEKHYLASHSGYFNFIIEAVKFAKKMGKIDILVLDNRKATIPGFLIKKMLNPDVTIQDCRELYISHDTKRIVGKIGCFFEKIMIKHSDVIIAANEDRARMMKEIYFLSEMPLVYENLRTLEYQRDPLDCEEKLKKYIKPDEYRIVSTSGCSISRTNDVLVKNANLIDRNVRILLIGESTTSDIKQIKTLIKDNCLNNVEIIDNLDQSDLKWIISNSHIGIVNYNQLDLNNKYCASGKLYEFIYEGIPVVTTENPPLKKICSEHQVGISSDQYYDGINKILKNYDFYKDKIRGFVESNTVEDNNKKLTEELVKRIEKLGN